MEYWERDLDSDVKTMVVCGPGEMVLSEPNKVHKTVFLQDTVLVTFARGFRGIEFDRDDTVKMDL
jgi:hypothetical protein